MKATKKFFSVFLSICMLVSITAGIDFNAYSMSSSGSCGANVTYTFNSSTGKLTISGTGAMYSYASSSSPFHNQSSIKSVVINSGVTSIGDDAFNGCEALISVTIPNSVTSIGDDAFNGCEALISVTFGNGVKTLGSWAFYGCDSLTSVTIPNSVTSLGTQTFGYCKGLTNVIIGNGVKTLGSWAFDNCTSLTSITIGNSVKSITRSAFSFCTSLKSITIPKSVTSIESSTFSHCTSLTSINVDFANSYYSSNDGVLYDKNKTELVAYPAGNTRTSFTIPSSVSYISQYAFIYCKNLKSVTIGKSVYDIGRFAFGHCSSLTSVTIPNSVRYVSDYAFYNCTNLTSVTFGKSVERIGEYAFYDCNNLKDVYFKGTSAQWKKIEFGANNSCLSSAARHYICEHNYKNSTTKATVKATISKNGTGTKACSLCGKVSTVTIYYPKTIKLSSTKYTYNGKIKKPAVKVVDSNGKTISSSNYMVTYAKGRKEIGTYKVTIKFKGNYSGTVTKTFKINPKASEISSIISPKKSTIAIKWKKVSGVSGYQVQHSTSKSFPSSETVTNTAKSSSANAKISKNIKSKKTYYVRIRTYKKVGKNTYYSSWSSAKTVTTK